MADATDAGPRCLQCRAALRPDAPWCSQCWAPVTAAVAAPAVRVPAQAGPRDDATSTGTAAPRPSPRDDALTAGTALHDLGPRDDAVPADGPASGTWPCSCGARTPLDQDVCASCGAGFLSDLRDGPPALVLPGVGDVAALSSAARGGLALTAVLCFLAVFASLCLLLS